MRKNKILVIAPHADDEVLGCGGYLLHKAKEGAEIHILIATIGGKDKRQVYEERIAEFDNVCKSLNAEGVVLYQNKDAELDTVSTFELVTLIDKAIDGIKPDEIFISYKSRHQDHIKLYQCALTSIRLREGYMPKFVALYEYPFVSDGFDTIDGGKMYHDISDNIEDKVKLFSCYKSQIRKSPSPLNEGGIKRLASYRGLDIGVDYAELFYVQKMIV